MKWPSLTPARVSFQDGGLVSEKFGDIYALPGRAEEEKAYVFLQGIGLGNLLKKAGRLAVGELGFGPGLNFLLTREATRKAGKALDYLAVEGFPLTHQDFSKTFESQGMDADDLLAAYPPLVPGFHRLILDRGQTTLTLVFGNVDNVLGQISGLFDAWYLDGFSPEKNPAMWSKETLNMIAGLTVKGGRVATYSAAGQVRRDLEAAGFDIQKRKGFDKKRECLAGTRRTGVSRAGLKTGSRIAIVGGGIAGCAAAHALRQKGYEVTLFEKAASLAAGTSGHPLAVFKPKLQKSPTPYSVFFLSAYLYSLNLYEGLKGPLGGAFHPVRGGLAHLKGADLDLAEAIPGFSAHVKVDSSGLSYPYAGVLIPENICAALTEGIEVRLNTAFSPDPAFSAVVFANGHHAFETFAQNPFRLTRGQINFLPETPDVLVTGTHSFPGGYLTPPYAGHHILGTSFEVWDNPEDASWKTLSRADLNQNLKALEKALGVLPEAWKNPELKGRTGLRCETIDHLPAVGPGFDETKFKSVFRARQKLHHSRRKIGGEADLEGVYVLSGFASRGFTAAPYAAEILASGIAGTPLPCPKNIRRALLPSRFLLKDLKGGKP